MTRKPFLIIAVFIILGGGFLAYRQFREQSDFPPFDAGKSKLSVDPAIVSGINDLGFDVLAQLAKEKPKENIFISPPSISTALTMAYNGARGETKDAMAKVLGLKGMSLEAVNLANSSLIDVMENLDPKARCAVANSFWADKSLAFNPDFEKNMRTAYDAEFGPLDVDVINAWVNWKTKGKIPTIVDDLGFAYLVLVNAIYFKGEWTCPFDKSLTKEGTFHAPDGDVTIPMMHQLAEFECSVMGDPWGIRLPYGDGRLSMYIFLPARGRDLKDIREDLSRGAMDRWVKGLRKQEIDVVLPRFKLGYKEDLLKTLSDLGMCPCDDLSGTCTPSGSITQVLHKTFVEVNEEGTEAAAATAVVEETGMPPSFVVDRPFFCMIRDDKTGLILFMGYIFDPKL